MAETTVTTRTCDNCAAQAEEISESRAPFGSRDKRLVGWGKVYWDQRVANQVVSITSEDTFVATRSMGADLCPECMAKVRAIIPDAELKEHAFWQALEDSVTPRADS